VTERLVGLVKELDAVLASDPETISPVCDVSHKNLPAEKCNVEGAIVARAFDSS
jgi:hypothetical protein